VERGAVESGICWHDGGMPYATLKTPEILDEICRRISSGETLRSICRDKAAGMPGNVAVYEWLEADKDFAERFARARNIGYDAIADEALEISDAGEGDYKPTTDKQGREVKAFDPEHVQRSKLRVWTRLQLLSKWSSGKYGDRVALEHSGSVDIATTIRQARNRVGG